MPDTAVDIADAPLPAPFDAGFRPFLGYTGRPTVVYTDASGLDTSDYDAERFLDSGSYDTAADAKRALNALLADLAADPDFTAKARVARRILAAGGPLTREQGLLVALASGENLDELA